MMMDSAENIQVPLSPKGAEREVIDACAAAWGFSVRPAEEQDLFYLEYARGCLQLCKRDEPRLGPVCVDLSGGTNRHRLSYGGGRGQALARAMGVKKGCFPAVVDATAGFGRDAFVLASLGCRVHMLERSNVVAALLDDGLTRALQDARIGAWVRERISFTWQDSINGLQSLPFAPDAVYCDPMFPQKKKLALVKKEMRILKNLLGPDEDVEDLLEAACAVAGERVVVKRPAYAAPLAGRAPHSVIKTEKNRFDMYMMSRS